MLGAGIAVLVALAAVGASQKTNTGSPPPLSAVPSAGRSAAVLTANPSGTPARFGPIGNTTEATVVRIVDGDTIIVAFGGKEYKLRYIGMDSPETVDPNNPVEWMGAQATAANTQLVGGKTVFLEKDVSEVDRYDRLLRHVWLTDGAAWTLVNLELVRQGVASAKSYPPDVRYDQLYVSAESQAKSSALGLWGASPAPPTAAPTIVGLIAPIPAATPKPKAAATPKPKPAAKCHPSYDPCLPIVSDLDCKDIRAMGVDPVSVIGPDKYRLDADGDGLGCE